MHKSPAAIIFARLSLVLAMTAVDRAASPPATQPALPVAPEDVFRDKGLTWMGFWLIVPDEADIHRRTRSLEYAEERLGGENAARTDSELSIKEASDRLDSLESQESQVDSQLNQAIANEKKIDRRDFNALNNAATQISSLLGQHDALDSAIDQTRRQLIDLEKQQANATDSRSAYLNLAIDLQTKADSAVAMYQKLKKDPDLISAILQYNQTNVPHARLGPSGLFDQDLDFIHQCTSEVQTGSADVMTDAGGDPSVKAVLNGKFTDTMVWDSGAAEVTLNYATAQALGLKLSDKDEVDRLTAADGKNVDVHTVMLDSIQLGGFTVHHVPCAVMPAEYGQVSDLLGDTFQRHFLARLDQAGGKLQLTPIDPDVTQGMMVQAPPIPTTADSSTQPGAPADAPNRIDTADMIITGHHFQLADVSVGGKAFSNRKYTWATVPDQFTGWKYTQTRIGAGIEITIQAKHDVTIDAMAAAGWGINGLDDWDTVNGAVFVYSDRPKTKVQVYEKSLLTGDKLTLPASGRQSMLLLVPPDGGK